MPDTNQPTDERVDRTALLHQITQAVKGVLPMSSTLTCDVVADAVLSAIPETVRLRGEILTLQAELASMRDLLRTENERANAAIGRETATEEAVEEQRHALAITLGLDAEAAWDTIRARAGELATGTGRGAVLREAAEMGRTLSRQGYSAQEIAKKLDRLADAASGSGRVADETQQDEAHRCGNCEGIDPDSCPMNPDRVAVSQPDREA
ncbi:hypothetical protein [Streptomyces sp. NPDC007074]|uniref:hypothetical protein n=1 Tax=Streptomyces sp. NPDC007074 TaxID=3156764 RepID=UPI0033ED2BFF